MYNTITLVRPAKKQQKVFSALTFNLVTKSPFESFFPPAVGKMLLDTETDLFGNIMDGDSGLRVLQAAYLL